MSYDIELVDPVSGESLNLDYPHQMRGGTYKIGGTEIAHINITYNYGRYFYEIFGDKGIRFLYGLSGHESIPHLEEGIQLLGNDTDSNYWVPTEGNAKRALINLLALAQMRPDGVWQGD